MTGCGDNLDNLGGLPSTNSPAVRPSNDAFGAGIWHRRPCHSSAQFTVPSEPWPLRGRKYRIIATRIVPEQGPNPDTITGGFGRDAEPANVRTYR